MSIADQLKIAKADLDAVYEAGKKAGGGGGGGFDVFKYVTAPNRMFYRAVFDPGTELVVNMPSLVDGNISEMFRIASGIKKLTLIVPMDGTYNASYFVYDTKTQYSMLEELHLPNGIKFSNFSNFAQYNSFLKTVSGSIDLSESTNNDNCFTHCPELIDIEFVPETIKKSISFAQSGKLSDASIASILGGLSPAVSGQTLTVHPDVAAKITETDVTSRGWALVY